MERVEAAPVAAAAPLKEWVVAAALRRARASVVAPAVVAAAAVDPVAEVAEEVEEAGAVGKDANKSFRCRVSGSCFEFTCNVDLENLNEKAPDEDFDGG